MGRMTEPLKRPCTEPGADRTLQPDSSGFDAPGTSDLEQVYLDDDVRAWAEPSLGDATTEASDVVRTRDSNGNELVDGDSVTLVRNLDVKGAGFVAKQGTKVNDIRLTGDPGLVEGRINKVTIVLKTSFLKKA